MAEAALYKNRGSSPASVSKEYSAPGSFNVALLPQYAKDPVKKLKENHRHRAPEYRY